MRMVAMRHPCNVRGKVGQGARMAVIKEVLFVLLAGGQSRRMGGGDKNLLDLAGQPVIKHVIARAVPKGAPAIINANGDAARYASFELPVVADVIDGFAGPLAGILTGLEWAAENRPNCSHVISLATDAPFLPPDLATGLMDAVESGAELAQAQSNDRRHPVFAIWPVALAAALRSSMVDDDVRKIDRFTANYSCKIVPFAGDPDPFMNLNTPEDIALAQQLLGG